MARTSPRLQQLEQQKPAADPTTAASSGDALPIVKKQTTNRGENPSLDTYGSASKRKTGKPTSNLTDQSSPKVTLDSNEGGAEETGKNHAKSTASQSSAKAPPHSQRRSEKKEKNELSQLIPQYKAPLRLGPFTSAAVTLTDLQRQATKEEMSNQQLTFGAASSFCGSKAVKSFKTGQISKRAKTEAASASMGDGWFGMRPSPMTEEVRADLALIRNRNYLDPKRFYKSADVKTGKQKHMLQVGTVIEGAAEFYSSRLSKKQRRGNLTDEVLADSSISGYARTKFRNMQRVKTAAGEKSRRKRRGGRRK